MRESLAKLVKSVRDRGALATTRLLGEALRSKVRRRYRYWQEWRFDRSHAIRTRGLVRGVGNEHSLQYQPLFSPTVFYEALRHVETKERTFIDLGCGRGKVLYLARDMGFSRIIGVEIDSRLCADARRNAPWAEVVEEDAARYRFPAPPLVVYMYNPFDATVLQQVLEALPDGEVTVIYQTPQFHPQVAAMLSVIASDPSPQGWVVARLALSNRQPIHEIDQGAS